MIENYRVPTRIDSYRARADFTPADIEIEGRARSKVRERRIDVLFFFPFHIQCNTKAFLRVTHRDTKITRYCDILSYSNIPL